MFAKLLLSMLLLLPCYCVAENHAVAGGEQAADRETSARSGGALARIYCTQCHVMPDPHAHTAMEWPLLIQRMKKNIQASAKKLPGDEELKSIIEFYQQAGR